MFLVGIAGPNLAISGAVFTERFVVERFTDYIYLGPLPSGGVESDMGRSIRRVANILVTLRTCMDELEDYYRNLKPRRPDAISGMFPAPHFQAYSDGNKRYKIEYTERLKRQYASGTVFKGRIEWEGDEGKGKDDVVIKFTNGYCGSAHELLAKMSLAPKLWHCKNEESVGMYVVVMGYVGGKEVGDVLTDEGHMKQLRRAMNGLHEAGYAHGNLRGPHLLIAKDGLKVIDFDWCGKAGEARYPADINVVSDIEWHEGVCRGGVIEKAHDEHMFKVLTVPKDER